MSCSFGFCQDSTTLLNGSVKSPNNEVSDILIVNLNSKISTITDSLGRFSITVKLKDIIRFTAVQYLPKDISVTDEILESKSIIITLSDNVIDLSEVTVTPYNLTGKIDLDIERLALDPAVTSSSLGLPNADLVKMTHSERLLLEADRGKYISLATIDNYGKINEILSHAFISVSINTHKIMNRVSGRTKSLEERVERDEKMELEKEIISKFSKKSMSDSFHIPEIHMDGFLTYCISQEDFLELSQAGNTVELWDYLKDKSIEFREADTLKQ
ncbi:hypothetical protein A9200_14580 [Maribacter hydrothermalis]|uniref:CarboxypepD_reg-like domain-containing protein n=2 Tax=Maribacter hydrothermalis TaxID=1836467 RepID=A0A1B7ZCV5_9FLAO|nr:hypothetical protein BTR34_15470 [Maribacter hydrothermalis]OBR40812.1 hypothetical protein A9200_14580 [Maribacter hydrothermalis]